MNLELKNEKRNVNPRHLVGGDHIRIRSVLYNPFVQILGALIVISVFGIGVFYFWQQSRIPIFHDPTTLLTLRYPSLLVRESITKEDKNAKIIFRAKQAEMEAGVPMLVTVRYEEGLRKVSSMLRYDIIDILTDNVDKLFPREYPKFEKINEKRYTIHGKRAGEIIFSYLSPTGEQIQQRFVVLMRDEDLAVYITVQAKQKDFEMLNKKYFDNLISSVEFQYK